MGVERAGRQTVDAVELTRVGDPLVDEHQAGRVAPEQIFQRRAGAGRGAVSVSHQRIALHPAELPGKLAPQRADLGAVVLLVYLAGSDLGAYQHRAVRGGQRLDARALHELTDAGQLRRRRPREQVVERQQRVRLATAEVSLQIDDRHAALAGHALNRLAKQQGEALGEEGAAEELGRLPVLVNAAALVDLVQIGSELGLDVPATGHVGVRPHDLAPRVGADPDSSPCAPASGARLLARGVRTIEAVGLAIARELARDRGRCPVEPPMQRHQG